MRFVSGFLSALTLLAVGIGLVIWTGSYNVAATDAHTDPVAWALDTTLKNPVERRAGGIIAPQFSEEQMREGFGMFDEMCVQCHGGPGVERSEWAMGLKPKPPSLAQASQHWSAGEVFWILQNGIKMSGMPALGPTHGDEELWSTVAFVKRLPEIDAAAYARLRAESGGGHHGEEGGGESGEQHSEVGGESNGETHDPEAPATEP